MKLIGVKRAVLLFFMLGANALLLAVFFLVAEPMRTGAESNLRSVKAQVESLRKKTSDIKKELALYKEKKPVYDSLESRGFYLPQDSFMIERKLNELREMAGLAGFAFEVGEQKDIDNKEAKAAKVKLVSRQITVKQVSALVDLHFYDFIARMHAQFPEHVRMERFRIARKDDVNQASLQRVSRGEKVSFIDGEVVFDWYTIAPQGAEPAAGGRGGR